MSTDQEQDAITRTKAGDASAFAVLYDAYVRKIHAYLYYRVHHRETAEDLTSIVFMKAYERIGGYDAAKGGFSSWLYTIARNALTDHFRARKETANIEDVWDALAADVDIPRDLDARAKLADVDAHLAKLTPVQREVILLRVWDGLSHAEIAALTGRSEAACKMAFSRGIGALREAMPLAAFLLFLTTRL